MKDIYKSMDNEMKTTFIKKTIINKSRSQRIEFGFDASIDWTPGKGACWIDCPFSVCTSLGHRCKALVDNQCPFTKNMETFNYDDYGDGMCSLIRDIETGDGADGLWELILPTDDTTQKKCDSESSSENESISEIINEGIPINTTPLSYEVKLYFEGDKEGD